MSEKIIPLKEVRDILPVKPELMLLDRVLRAGENQWIGLKSISLNEQYFTGHFPGHPIMPGVLQVEAIAQLAELAVWERLDPERKGDIYIKSMSKIKFRRPNNPGDRAIIEVNVTSVKDCEAVISASVKNNSGVTCQATEMVLAVRERVWESAMPAEFNEFDKSEHSEMDVTKIMSYIPHRFPFLFVDYVSKIEGSHVTGVKNVTNTEPILREYRDDGYSVLMGSVQPEIIAQAGCIYMLSNEASKGKIAYFMSIEKSEFYHPVRPGDQMRLEVDIPDNTKRFGKGEGFMIVDGKVMSKTNMMFAIVDP